MMPLAKHRASSSLKLRRRGFAVVIVLGLLALTLGLSYALLRTHTTDHELQRNQSRKVDARGAAQTGMSVALRKLYDGTWSGADTSFTGYVTEDQLEGFVVTYTTGDSSLTAASASWSEYPFRLTIDCQGFAIDPNTSTSRSEYTIQVVTQMVRRKLNTNQVTVANLEDYSLYQSGNQAVRLHPPLRVTGKFHIQGEIEFSRYYPAAYRGTGYQRYYDDVYKMFAEKGWDYRPFTGTLYTPGSRQPSTGDVVQVLDAKLRVPRVNVTAASQSPVPKLTSYSGYRLYDKGKVYTGETLAAVPDSLNVVPDADYLLTSGSYTGHPQTNPLGVFTFSSGSLGIYSDTTLQGVLLAKGSGGFADIHVGGQNVVLSAPSLPAISGDATNYRFPIIMAKDDVRIHDGTNRTIEGWISCGDEFQVKSGLDSSAISVTGGVFCSNLYLDQRSTVPTIAAAWDAALDSFLAQTSPSGMNSYLPGWISSLPVFGLDLQHRLIFNPTPAGVKNHVPDWTQPIYTAHPDDGGLQWDIVRWQEE